MSDAPAPSSASGLRGWLTTDTPRSRLQARAIGAGSPAASSSATRSPWSAS